MSVFDTDGLFTLLDIVNAVNLCVSMTGDKLAFDVDIEILINNDLLFTALSNSFVSFIDDAIILGEVK